MHTAYEVRNLCKSYPNSALPANQDVSFDVHQGEVFGLLGPNGAGKTTLIRQMAGLARPSSGSIRLFGVELTSAAHLASRWVALQPQGFALPAAERPRSLLEVTGQLRGMSPASAKGQTNALLEQFGLVQYAHKPFNALSGGLRRLVSIACALIGNRPVLIFDEPTNDLDPGVRRTVWSTIRNLAKQGTTVLLVTHNVVEAEEALDRVAIIRGGRILAVGTPGLLKSQVSQQVRIEVALRPNKSVITSAATAISSWVGFQPTGAFRYALTVQREEAEAALSKLLPYLDGLDDFRIVTPNLEDVYHRLTGGERLAE